MNSFSFPSVGRMLAIGLSYVAFITLNYNSSVPNFFRELTMKGCRTLSNAFSVSIEMTVVSVLKSTSMLIYIYVCICTRAHGWVCVCVCLRV